MKVFDPVAWDSPLCLCESFFQKVIINWLQEEVENFLTIFKMIIYKIKWPWTVFHYCRILYTVCACLQKYHLHNFLQVVFCDAAFERVAFWGECFRPESERTAIKVSRREMCLPGREKSLQFYAYALYTL